MTTLLMETENELGNGCITVILQGPDGHPSNPGSLHQTLHTLCALSPHPAMRPPCWDQVPSPSGSKAVSNLSTFQGTQNYFARKREGAGGS